MTPERLRAILGALSRMRDNLPNTLDNNQSWTEGFHTGIDVAISYFCDELKEPKTMTPKQREEESK